MSDKSYFRCLLFSSNAITLLTNTVGNDATSSYVTDEHVCAKRPITKIMCQPSVHYDTPANDSRIETLSHFLTHKNQNQQLCAQKKPFQDPYKKIVHYTNKKNLIRDYHKTFLFQQLHLATIFFRTDAHRRTTSTKRSISAQCSKSFPVRSSIEQYFHHKVIGCN